MGAATVCRTSETPDPRRSRWTHSSGTTCIRSADQLFSGNPNGVLVTEVTDLPPGQALDVGCGEGADALWLARHGWQVTAVDISPTALDAPPPPPRTSPGAL